MPIPNLEGALCIGQANLFETTIDNHAKRVPRAELNRARAAALRVCAACPALDPCRAWLAAQRQSRRPRGVVAGQVVAANGQPANSAQVDR